MIALLLVMLGFTVGPPHGEDVNTEAASAIDVRTDRNGKTWIAVDSLVDLFTDMGSTMADGPAKKNLQTLAASFRPMSSYAEMEAALAPDDSVMVSRDCDVCGAEVIDGQNISGDLLVIDAVPTPDGALFPLRIVKGVPTLAPMRPGLDGITNIRVAAHACAVQS